MSEQWTNTLRGDDNAGPEDARIIRAIVKTHAEVTEQGISEEQLAVAKADLLARLHDDEQADEEKPEDANVIRPVRWAPQHWNTRQTGMLIAASVAIIAVGVLTFSRLDTSGQYDPLVIASYAEIDTVRGLEDRENRMVVGDPDEYGRMLAGQLTDRKIPFVLLREFADASDRILKVQVDGHANLNNALQWLQELGISDAPTSVVVIRLTAEEGP